MPQTQTAHTPLSIKAGTARDPYPIIISEDGQSVIQVLSGLPDARYIVQCVNSYAALVDALDTLWLHAHWGHATASTDSRETCTMQDCLDARAALALAKEE